MSKKLRIIPLGGLGEVGKNMMAYEFDDQILVVDAGLMFPENDMIGLTTSFPILNIYMTKATKSSGLSSHTDTKTTSAPSTTSSAASRPPFSAQT